MAEHTQGREGFGPSGDWGGWDFRGPWFAGRQFDLRSAFGPWRAPFVPGGHGPGHGPGRGPGGRGRGGRGRSGRGNMRAAVLTLLLERPMHGYEMIQELEERTGGMWRPSPGSIYPTLQLMEDEGLIVSEQDQGKRRYTLTDEGRTRAEQVEDVPWREHTEGFDWETINKLRSAVAQLMTAFGQILATATDEQKAQAAEVLQETRRKLYAILADAGVTPGHAEPDADDEDDEPDVDDEH
jgi:DNA-binding PadR family transcriptional regulator